MKDLENFTTYATQDIGIAIILYASRARLSAIDESNGKPVFIFDDWECCTDIVNNHLYNNLEIESVKFIEAYRSIIDHSISYN